MIKKMMATMSCLLALSGISQQQQQIGNMFSNVSLNNQNYVQRQSNPVILATNKGNLNNQSKAAGNNQVNRRNPVQQNVSRNVNPHFQPLVQNDDVQQVQMQMNVSDNNVGNEINFIQQISAAEVPAIQMGSGNIDLNLNLNLEMKMPTITLNRRVAKSKSESNSSRHKLVQFEKKLKKMNRKFSAKIKHPKKLKIKVDNCFEW